MTGEAAQIGTPRPLFRLRTGPVARLDGYSYAVAADGRVLVNTSGEAGDCFL